MCLQLISFIDRHVDHWNWTNGRYYQKGFPLQNIKTRHKIKHNEMGLEHLIKTITHSWRVGAKIMKQSKQVLKKYSCKLPRRKEGRARLFFGFNMQNQDTGLPALVVALCSNRSKLSDRNWMPCKRGWIAFPVVWMLFLPFRPQPLNREQLHFALCV